MAYSLNYKVKRNEWGVVITWVDITNNLGNRDIVSTITWSLFGLMMVFVILSMPSLGVVYTAVGIGVVICFLLPRMLEPRWSERNRSMTVTPKVVTVRGRKYSLPSVTRVEYGERGSWDMSNPKLKNMMQVRLWIDDRHPIILSENNWTQEVNHALHGNIQDELERYRRQETEPTLQASEQEQVTEFGMPDY